MKKQYRDLPVQVETLIKSILNKNDPVYVRANYYTRLEDIRDAVTDAMTDFNLEYDQANTRKPTKK